VLAFVNPLDRSVVMQIPVELERIVALAYSSKTGNLYAANSASSNKSHSGIFRVDATEKNGAPACKLKKVASVETPTSLAFAPNGTLYITVSGQGILQRIDDVP
jgi:hypothetical protein